jgi:hypothetical protein
MRGPGTFEQQLVDERGDGGREVERMLDDMDGESPDKGKPSLLGTALLELVRTLVRPGNARATAQRFVGLCLVLCPDVLGLSQRTAAAQLRLTRASLSKTTLQLAEEWNLGHSRWRKSQTARIRYSRAQKLAYSSGRHASQVVKKRKLKKARTG